jgi:hypothetical protein
MSVTTTADRHTSVATALLLRTVTFGWQAP